MKKILVVMAIISLGACSPETEKNSALQKFSANSGEAITKSTFRIKSESREKTLMSSLTNAEVTGMSLSPQRTYCRKVGHECEISEGTGGKMVCWPIYECTEIEDCKPGQPC